MSSSSGNSIVGTFAAMAAVRAASFSRSRTMIRFINASSTGITGSVCASSIVPDFSCSRIAFRASIPSFSALTPSSVFRAHFFPSAPIPVITASNRSAAFSNRASRASQRASCIASLNSRLSSRNSRISFITSFAVFFILFPLFLVFPYNVTSRRESQTISLMTRNNTTIKIGPIGPSIRSPSFQTGMLYGMEAV